MSLTPRPAADTDESQAYQNKEEEQVEIHVEAVVREIPNAACNHQEEDRMDAHNFVGAKLLDVPVGLAGLEVVYG